MEGPSLDSVTWDASLVLRLVLLSWGEGQGFCSSNLGKGNQEPGPEKLQKAKVAESAESLVCQLHLGDTRQHGMLKDQKVPFSRQESRERLGQTSLLI